jgi:hypothetical protein
MKATAVTGCVFALLTLGFAAGPRTDSLPAQVGVPALRCEITVRNQPLPSEVRETSGLARSRQGNDLFWTHNDSKNEPILFGLNSQGQLVARVRIGGATFRDWEDIEAVGCSGGNCLLLADVGDNNGRRGDVAVYRVAEPAAGESRADGLEVLRARYPDKPQDAEAIFQLPRGEVFVVTKGRHGPVGLYRFPEWGAGGGQLTKVRDLWPQPPERHDWVTAATATPDGRWVILRTYRTLHFFLAADLLEGEGPSARFELEELGQLQGEAVAASNDGTVWLTSEARGKNDLPQWSSLSCPLPPAR